MLLHGGFWRDRYDLRLEDALVADLAGRGFAVWNLEYRRLGRDGGGWPATFEDVAAGIDQLADRVRDGAPLDLGRVVTVGHSAGGHLACWAATHSEQEVPLAGAVAQAGVLDLAEASRLGLSDSATELLLGGSPSEHPERYALASPIERLPAGVPQLLVHGERDDIVPPAIARAYSERAREAGDACDLVMLPEAGHFDHLDPTSEAWAAVIDWLGRTVKP